jgi:hypothetical protein
MKAKEFGAWPPRNDFKGGQRYSANGYNKSFKKERFPSTQEYANRNLDEYHRFEGTKDFTKEPDVKKTDERQSNHSKKTDNANKMRQRVLQQAVGIVVGSTVVVTSYQAQVEERAKQQILEPTAIVVENIDTEIQPEEDILEEIEASEPIGNNEAKTSGSNKGKSGSKNSRNSSRGGGSSRGNTGNVSIAENNDELDVDEQDIDILEPEEIQDIDEDAEILPDIQQDNNEDINEDTADSDSQDPDSSDDNNSENDNADTNDLSDKGVQESKRQRHTSTSSEWLWDLDEMIASLIIKNGSGNVISSASTIPTYVEESPSCREDGKITYTATVEIDGTEYTDVKYVDLLALGHDFDSYEEIFEGGQKIIRFECSRCHEIFQIKNSIDEE